MPKYLPLTTPKPGHIPKQTCTTCPHQSKCWAVQTNTGKPVSTQNVLINVLICRMQLGIDRDKSAQNLLNIFRPGMIRLISHVRQQGSAQGMNMDQLLLDMQSMAIEYLLYDYKIGDRGRATPYLFDPHQGFLTKWIKWVVGKHRRFYKHHELYSTQGDDGDYQDDSNGDHHVNYGTQSSDSSGWAAIMEGSDSLRYDPYTNNDDRTDLVQKINSIIEDGTTLNSNEYRVIKFCMMNGNESNATRHIDGLHIYLAKLMGVSRPRITRLYKRAKDKLQKRYLAVLAEDSI